MVIPLMLILSSVSLSGMEFVFAQSGNSIGLQGDGNEVSQSDENPQGSSQNSMCVSGESVSLSCNDLSGQNIGSAEGSSTGPVGPQGPQEIPANKDQSNHNLLMVKRTR